MTKNPDALLASPTELRDLGLCEFRIDTDGDAREDASFRLVVIDLVGQRHARGGRSRGGGAVANRDGWAPPWARCHG